MTSAYVSPIVLTTEEVFRQREAKIRDCLGRWVSELEPVLVYTMDGEFQGLTYAGNITGQIDVIVEARSYKEINETKHRRRRFASSFAHRRTS